MEKLIKFVVYTRCSTVRQGQSGLGLEAQRQAVNSYASKGIIVAEFVEVETGTSKRKRIEIYKAIELCKQIGGTLLIAKLDRLARSVVFTATLLESKVPFIACDAPFATPLTIHILSAVAENEAKLISDRTRVSLQVAKQRGIKLGSPQNLTDDARRKGAKMKSEIARNNENNKKATTVVMLLKKQNNCSFNTIAKELNSAGFLTSQGKLHTSCSAWLLYKRALNNERQISNSAIHKTIVENTEKNENQ